MKSLSVIKNCPLLGGSLTAIVTFGTKHFVCYWRHVCYFGCPLWRAFTVIIIKIAIPVLNNDTVLKYCKNTYKKCTASIWEFREISQKSYSLEQVLPVAVLNISWQEFFKKLIIKWFTHELIPLKTGYKLNLTWRRRPGRLLNVLSTFSLCPLSREITSRIYSQSAITCSKLTIETLEQGVKYVQVNDKDTRTTFETSKTFFVFEILKLYNFKILDFMTPSNYWPWSKK